MTGSGAENMRIQIVTGLIWIAFLAQNRLAHAEEMKPVPKQSDICVVDEKQLIDNQKRLVVDKQKLVDYLLDANKIRRGFERALPPDTDGPYAKFSAAERLFLDNRFRNPRDTLQDDFKKKYKDDLNNLDTAYQALIALLGSEDAYRNTAKTLEPGTYLSDPKAQLECLRTDENKPKEAPGAEPTTLDRFLANLRLRGSTDGLYFDRACYPDQFKSLDSASINFTGDNIKNTFGRKFIGITAYDLYDTRPDGDDKCGGNLSFQVIGYVGTNVNITRTTGKPSKTTAETVDPGLLFAYYTTLEFRNKLFGNFFTARPDYLFDLANHSRLFSLQLAYTPIIDTDQSHPLQRYLSLNYVHPVIFGRNDFMSFQPILTVRFNQGVYTDKGTTNPAQNRNYARMGPQTGLALISDNSNLPLTLTLTDTFLGGFSGKFDHLNYFKSVLSLNLDPKKYTSFSVSYSNGRREDTTKREKLWSTGLTLRY
jgi:hypothetical protein